MELPYEDGRSYVVSTYIFLYNDMDVDVYMGGLNLWRATLIIALFAITH